MQPIAGFGCFICILIFCTDLMTKIDLKKNRFKENIFVVFNFIAINISIVF